MESNNGDPAILQSQNNLHGEEGNISDELED